MIYDIPNIDKIAMAVLGVAALLFIIAVLKDIFTSLEWFDMLHKKYGYEVDEERWLRNHPEDMANKKLAIDDSYLSQNSKAIIKRQELNPHA